MHDRLRRCAAFLIDWNLCLLPAVLVGFGIGAAGTAPGGLMIFFVFALFFGGMACFVLRDWVFGERSLGKRLLGLSIYDKATMEPASKRQRQTRNLFFFIMFIEAIALVFTGETIGDRCAGTVVLSPRARAAREEEAFMPKKRNAALSIILGIAAFVLVTVILVFVMLSFVKDTPEYDLAYSYLISSDAFAQLGAEEEDVLFNQYRSKRTTSPDGSYSHVTEFGFQVGMRSFVVVCHEEDGQWWVCEECTKFD